MHRQRRGLKRRKRYKGAGVAEVGLSVSSERPNGLEFGKLLALPHALVRSVHIPASSGYAIREGHILSKPAITTTHEETSETDSFTYAGTLTHTVEDYVFTVKAYFSQSSQQTATEKLATAIKPQVLRTLAKMKPDMLPCNPQMPCEQAAGRR